MLCQFPLYDTGNRLHVYIRPLPNEPPSTPDQRPTPRLRSSEHRAEPQLHSSALELSDLHRGVCKSVPPSQLSPPFPSSAVSTSPCLCSCPSNSPLKPHLRSLNKPGASSPGVIVSPPSPPDVRFPGIFTWRAPAPIRNLSPSAPFPEMLF